MHLGFFPTLIIAALIPLLVGFVWYHPKVFGTAWKKEVSISDEQMNSSNMLLIFGLTFFFSILAAVVMSLLSIHQMHIQSIFANTPEFKQAGTELNMWYTGFIEKYGNYFRSFKHGAIHGVLAGIFFALPVIGINALFERRSAKYILINVGYWIVTLALMGGIVCQLANITSQ